MRGWEGEREYIHMHTNSRGIKQQPAVTRSNEKQERENCKEWTREEADAQRVCAGVMRTRVCMPLCMCVCVSMSCSHRENKNHKTNKEKKHIYRPI